MLKHLYNKTTLIKTNTNIFPIFTKKETQEKINLINGSTRFVFIHNSGVDHVIFSNDFSSKYNNGYSYGSFWLAHTLLHLLPIKNTPLSDWFNKYTQHPVSGIDKLRAINKHLSQKNIHVMFIYNFTNNETGIRCNHNILNAIFTCWLEKQWALTNIHPKILIDKITWDKLNFTNKAHYANKSIELNL